MKSSSLGALAPLRRRHYRLLYGSLALALFGTGGWTIFLALQALSLNASAVALSGVVAWTGIGLLATALLGGVAADRWPRKRLLAGVLAINLATSLVVTTLSLTDTVQLWQLSCSAFVMGASLSFFFPAYTALVPSLVPAEELLAVNGLEGATRPTIQQAMAPAVTGAVVGAAVPGLGSLVVAGAFFLALGCIFAVPEPQPESTPDAERPHPARDLIEGFRYTLRTRWVLATVIYAAGMSLVVTGPVEVVLPATMRNGFDNGATLYGLAVAALGVGGLIGSLVTGSLTAPRRYFSVMIGCWAIGCLPLIVLAFTITPWIVACALFVHGGLVGAGMVLWGTLLQEKVPLEMLGRVASLDFFISVAFMPLSIGLTGLLAEHFSVKLIFFLAGIVPPVLALTVTLAARLRAEEMSQPPSQPEPALR
ncbi:MFS transporter [Frankia sp. QA3]|uniref:MFS transporter n=1 Tax=Frankia sp. QA3 TaxID=710111 RepID=UPI000269C24C|nr:MFS transporter [Frankia sp. QA3]EIV92807.1 arabinose efflux permease family protein [Frankia sp. QA3]